MADELRVDITATDKASAVVKRVKSDVDDLAKADANVDLTATDNASGEIDDVARKLANLSDDDKTVVLRARADQLEREVQRSMRMLANLERYDDTEIAVRLEARDNAQRKLDATRAQLRELDGATAQVDVAVDDDQLDRALGKLDDMGGKFGDIASLARTAAGPAAIGALVTGLFQAADYAAETALEVDQLANLTGDSVDYASRLLSVWKQTGAEGNDLQDVMLQLSGVLADQPELAARLGISLDDGRTMGERFVQVVELLGERVTDATDRGVVGSQLFGEEGVRQVNAIASRVGDLSDAIENVPDAALVSDAEVLRAQQYARSMAEIRTTWQGFAAEAGGKAVPVVRGLTALLSGEVFTSEYWNQPSNGALLLGDAVKRAGDSIRAAQAEAAAPGIKAFSDQLAGVRAEGDLVSVTTEQLAELARENAEADEEAADAARDRADALDEQRRKTDDLVGANLQLVGGDIAVANASSRADRAVSSYSDTLADAEATTDDKTQAERDALSAILASADATVNYTAQQAAAAGQTFTNDQRTRAMATALSELRDRFPQLAGPIGAYIDQLNRIPREITTRLRVTGQQFTADGDQIGGRGPRDRGGFAPDGALVAERRPEFVNGQLVTSPTLVGPGADIIGGSETARLLSGSSPSITYMTVQLPAGTDPAAVFRATELDRRRNRR
jgi:hypothetical protein